MKRKHRKKIYLSSHVSDGKRRWKKKVEKGNGKRKWKKEMEKGNGKRRWKKEMEKEGGKRDSAVS